MEILKIDPKQISIPLTTAVTIALATVSTVAYIHSMKLELKLELAELRGSIGVLSQRMDDKAMSSPSANLTLKR